MRNCTGPAIALFVFFSAFAHAAEPTTSTTSRVEQFYKGPKPIAVVVEFDPWNTVRGSDMPRVTVYDDGQVIFCKPKNDRTLYLTKKLDPTAFAELKKKIESFGDCSKFASYYNLSRATDQVMIQIYLSVGKPFVTSIYGLSSARRENKASALPAALGDIYDYLTSLDFPDAKPWTPPYVEMMLWDFSHAQGQQDWPKQWPGIDSPSSFKHKHGDMISIFLPGKEIPNVKAYIRSLAGRCAVVIDGKKYSIDYRYAFPGEPVWKKAFADKRKTAKDS